MDHDVTECPVSPFECQHIQYIVTVFPVSGDTPYLLSYHDKGEDAMISADNYNLLTGDDVLVSRVIDYRMFA